MCHPYTWLRTGIFFNIIQLSTDIMFETQKLLKISIVAESMTSIVCCSTFMTLFSCVSYCDCFSANCCVFNSYCEKNVRCLESTQTYDVHVPHFLRNKLSFFVKHCLHRIPPVIDGIIPADISFMGRGTWSVRSQTCE